MENEGKKFDEEKLKPTLVYPSLIWAIAGVREYGNQKYDDPENWRKVDNLRERYTNALYRHLLAYVSDEMVDPESGLAHLAHLACNVMFLIEYHTDHGIVAEKPIYIGKDEFDMQADNNLGYNNNGYCNTGIFNNGMHNTGSYNTGNSNTGNHNTGNHNSGSFNRGNHISGYFNTQRPPIYVFNSSVDLDMWYSNNYENTIELIENITCTSDPQGQWEECLEEEKRAVFQLPNFDPAIFQELTGLNIMEDWKNLSPDYYEH